MKDGFTSRRAILLAAMGMAIGVGNIWRFPRLAAKFGGGTFIIPWLLFLLTWSIPLLLMEYAMGKKTGRSPFGAFVSKLGPRYGWMGGFVTLCSLFIMSYYSVIAGWCLNYLFGSVFHAREIMSQSEQYWTGFTSSSLPLLSHGVALLFSGWVISRGIARGVERINRLFVPTLFVFLALLSIRALTLPGAWKGVAYLGHIDPGKLLDYTIWLEALSQSAWSTGAGWGLILVYAVYLRDRDDITLNTFLTGLGNNSASLLAALAIIPTIFAVLPASGVESVLSEGNVGITFIYLPRIFDTIPAGSWAMILFFLSLSLAALSSLIAMVQLGVNFLMDFGLSRRTATMSTILFGFVVGLPSALSQAVFNNQDWVWGLGLIISGGFFIFLLMRTGSLSVFHMVQDHPGNDLIIPVWFWRVSIITLPLQWLGLMAWWITLSILKFDSEGWWNPVREFSLGTCLLQWGIILALLILSNRYLVRRLDDR